MSVFSRFAFFLNVFKVNVTYRILYTVLLRPIFGTVSTIHLVHSISIHDLVPCLCFTPYITKGDLPVSVLTRGLMSHYQESLDPAV